MSNVTQYTAGIGATLMDGGCFFKVWAPNAKEVYVTFKPNSKKKVKEYPLERSTDGYWFGFIKGAKEGQSYNYVIYDSNGKRLERVDLAARDTLHSMNKDNAGYIVDTKYDWSDFKTPDYSNFIIYQLHVGAFNVEKGEQGTFKSLIKKLDYIRELGFNAIELLPVQEYKDDRSWGYNPSFFFAPESAYGTPDDLRELVYAAQNHEKGLAVIFDVVFNHVADRDADSVHNPMWKYDGEDEAGGIYFNVNGTVYYFNDMGPKPAFWKREVRNFFIDNAVMYFEEYNADGLRFDAVHQIPSKYFRQMVREIKTKDPVSPNMLGKYADKFLSGENFSSHNYFKPNLLDAQWDEESFNGFLNVLHGDLGKLYQMVNNKDIPVIFGKSWNRLAYLLGSHDKTGFLNLDHGSQYYISRLGGRNNEYARAQVKMAWVINVTMPCTPMMFMGSETLMEGTWHDNGQQNFDWELAADEYAEQMSRLVADANRIRWNNKALRSRNSYITDINYETKVAAFKRYDFEGNVILVIANFSNTNYNSPHYRVSTDGQTGEWEVLLCSQCEKYGIQSGAVRCNTTKVTTGSDGKVGVELPMWSVVVLKLT